MSSGLCFPFATNEARERGGEVVHAYITNPATKKSFWHAWVERNGKVYDDIGHHMPIPKFYEMMNPEDVRRYSDLEAMVYAVRTKHHGPWELGETGPPPRVPRTRRRRG